MKETVCGCFFSEHSVYPTPKINSHNSLCAGCVMQPIASGWKLEIGQDSP